MKNVDTHSLKTCIFLDEYQFQSILSELFPGAEVSYDYEGISVDLNDDAIPTDELYSKLSDYFDVARITSVHIDDCDTVGVWIVYTNETEFEKSISPSNLAEFKGQIIDIFEDFAYDNDIEIPNADREAEIEDAKLDGEDPDELGLAIIYGEDYDTIGDVIEKAVGNKFTDSDTTKFDNSEMNTIAADILDVFTSLLKETTLSDNQKRSLTRKVKMTFANWDIYDLSIDTDTIMTKDKYDSITKSANVLCNYCENTDCEHCIVTSLCDDAYLDAVDLGVVDG